MAEMYGKARGLLPRPRRLDAHLRSRRPASTAATRSSAAGCRSPSAWRSATRCRAATALTACFFGEGAVDEGEFHESLNLASLWRLPVLFVCENNLYAMGMRARARRGRSRTSTRKAQGYRMPSEVVDGMDVVAVEAAARRAAEHDPRPATDPYFLECRTYRFRAHSMFDAQLTGTKDEIEAWKQQRPDRTLPGLARRSGPAARGRARARSRPRSQPRSRPRSHSPRPERWSRSRSSSASY